MHRRVADSRNTCSSASGLTVATFGREEGEAADMDRETAFTDGNRRIPIAVAEGAGEVAEAAGHVAGGLRT